MTEERFEELAAAYGGDVARWPQPEREAAALFLAGLPQAAGAILARETALDDALSTLPRFPVPAALVDRIVASAPAARPRRARWLGWLLPAGLSATLAAATVAGLMLGAQLGAHTATTSDGATATAELDVSGLAGDV